jgi:hypothetical protein
MFSKIIKLLTIHHPLPPSAEQATIMIIIRRNFTFKKIKQYFTVTKQLLTLQRHRWTGVTATYLPCNIGIAMENVDEL